MYFPEHISHSSIKGPFCKKGSMCFLRTEGKVTCKEKLTGWKPSRKLNTNLFYCNSLLNSIETDKPKINIPSAQTIWTPWESPGHVAHCCTIGSYWPRRCLQQIWPGSRLVIWPLLITQAWHPQRSFISSLSAGREFYNSTIQDTHWVIQTKFSDP